MGKFNRVSLATILAVFSVQVFADDNSWFTPENISAGLSTGFLSGEARERVYEPAEGGRKISQLDWKYNHAPVIKGSLNWDVMPRFTVGMSGWTTLSGSGGSMTDNDWLDPEQKEKTDYSRHPDTKLNYANQFDISLTGWILNEPDYRAGLAVGYQQSTFSWTSKGGSYLYDNGTDTGSFLPGQSVIGYSQTFKLPWIGIAGTYRFRDFELNGLFKYSNQGKVTDNDEHYLRDTTFRDRATGQKFYSLSADAGYYITDNAKVFVDVAWSRMLNVKGNITENDYGENTKTRYKDSSGTEYSNYMVTGGIQYRF
ncbi:omptin family outer membrane protease [Salmonella enterica]